jgi:hypothetical protein
MKRLLVMACFATSTAGQALAQDVDIAERLAAEIRMALPGVSVTIPDPYGLEITFAGQTRSVGIGSVRAACERDAAACDGAIRGYARLAASHMLETAPLTRDQLRIAVRSRPYLDDMSEPVRSMQRFVLEPLVGELVSVCYRDLPNGRRPISSRDLARLEMDEPAALALCKANSHHSLAPLASLWNAALPPQGIGVLRNGDDVTGYFATPEEWRLLAEQLDGLIVAVPGIDSILYARGDNPIDVDALQTLARQMHAQAAVPVSLQVFRWTPGGWVAMQQ